MGRFERSVSIKAPPEKVWEMLALDRYPEWMFLESVEYTSEVITPEDKYRVGATAHGTPRDTLGGKGGEPNNCHFEITESIEHEKITHRLWEKWGRGRLGGLTTYTLEPVDGGTKLTLLGVLEMPFGIFGKVIEPLILRISIKEYEKALENLKTTLEQ